MILLVLGSISSRSFVGRQSLDRSLAVAAQKAVRTNHFRPDGRSVRCLGKGVLNGNTWATYSRMSDKWARQWNTKARHVPRITQLYNDYRLLDEDYPIKGAKAALELEKIVRSLEADSDDEHLASTQAESRFRIEC